MTRPNDTLSDMFDVFSGTNANAAEDNLMEVNLNNPEADLPDASSVLQPMWEQRNNTMALLLPSLIDIPLIKVVQDALDAIKKLLKPPRVMGGGYKVSGLDDLL